MNNRRMVRSVAVVLVLATALIGGSASARPNSGPVALEIIGVQVGQGGELMLVSVVTRCDAPYVVQELVVEVSQLDGARFGLAAGDFGIVCDGGAHELVVGVPSSADRWDGGLTTVSASLTILDPVTFDPAGTATDSLTLLLPAPAEVEIADQGRLRRDGAVTLRVEVRCQDPWVVQELSVSLAQDGTVGTESGDFGIVCDGRWRRVRLTIVSDVGFVSGAAQADAFFTVIDPNSFDPVDQAQDSETISVR